MAVQDDATVAAKRAAVIKAREVALQAKADAVRAKSRAKAEAIRHKAEEKATRTLAKGEAHAARIEGIAPAEVERKIRLDVHGRPKPLMRGWIHAIATPLSLAAGIVLICLAHGTPLKWACAVFMTCSLILFGNSAAYHLGDWSPRVTDVLRRIDHVNIFLLIAGTYTPVSFALAPHMRNAIIAGIWSCTLVALIIHVIWISAPRWLYTVVYIVFGVSGVAFMYFFWVSPPPALPSWCYWPREAPATSSAPSSTRCASLTRGHASSDSMRSSTAAPSPATPATWSRSTW